MKAYICKEYGTPDVLQIREIPKPIPKDIEVLIKIHSTLFNAADIEYLQLDLSQ